MTDSPAVEIRRNDDGSVDEIVAKGCDVHIEQMDHDHFWMQIGNEVFGLYASMLPGTKKLRIELTHTETREP